MNEFIMEQLIYVIRLVAAAVCGGLVGYERQSRKKTAGVRTHVIIAVASAMMMIISKYGFNDVLGEYIKLDPSRVAAGIVTAIGFIGSGIIFFRNNSVSGITTSAGIWATVGVGMAMGCGMYVLGAVATIVIMTVETFWGRKSYLSRQSEEERDLEAEYREVDGADIYGRICKLIREDNCRLDNIQLTRKTDVCRLSAQMKTPTDYDVSALIGELQREEGMKRISIQ